MSLKYKTFNALMASVEKSPLSKFADNGLIIRSNYIKTAKKCNATLGIKLNKIKEAVLSIEGGRASLPPDFFRAMSAFLISEESLGWMYAPILGTRTQEYTKEEIINKEIPFEGYGCINSCGTGCYYVTRKYQDKEVLYKDIKPVTVSESSKSCFSEYSPNFQWKNTKYQIDIDLEANEISCNFSTGQIYLSYICDMRDEKGNLLILDHDITNSYYEWAVIEAVLIDVVYNGEADAARLLQDASTRMPIYRNEALEIVLIPEYQAMRKYNKKLESEFYYKQVAMFT